MYHTTRQKARQPKGRVVDLVGRGLSRHGEGIAHAVDKEQVDGSHQGRYQKGNGHGNGNLHQLLIEVVAAGEDANLRVIVGGGRGGGNAGKDGVDFGGMDALLGYQTRSSARHECGRRLQQEEGREGQGSKERAGHH